MGNFFFANSTELSGYKQVIPHRRESAPPVNKIQMPDFWELRAKKYKPKALILENDFTNFLKVTPNIS